MPSSIVCKPTPWFLLRAAAMILMFGIFAVMFYKDGKWGYRDKNLVYYHKQAFAAAVAAFGEKQNELGPAEWREFASTQKIALPEDRSVLPVGTPDSIPWPEELWDFAAVKAGLDAWPEKLFDPYRERVGLKAKLPDTPYDARKIAEQWYVFWICLTLTIVALFFLLRTMGRSMRMEDGTFHPAGGAPVKLSELVRLDLRHWQRKGLAFAWAKSEGGTERKIRIDGLTYGGFGIEQGQPAEKLMAELKAGFSGEIIDYEISSTPEEAADATPTTESEETKV
ncbi:MAG: hypothetical protein MUF31_06000 [Akkermansiaceae bacterium]|jgi:hypothetical protein|nr:hypothetical protein [Akkermansiaceae bacterium]